MIIQFLANLSANLDNGVLPACSVVIKKQLRLDNSAFGILGSMDFLGHALGSICAALLLQKIDSKLLLIFCLVFNMLSLIMFT